VAAAAAPTGHVSPAAGGHAALPAPVGAAGGFALLIGGLTGHAAAATAPEDAAPDPRLAGRTGPPTAPTAAPPTVVPARALLPAPLAPLPAPTAGPRTARVVGPAGRGAAGKPTLGDTGGGDAAAVMPATPVPLAASAPIMPASVLPAILSATADAGGPVSGVAAPPAPAGAPRGTQTARPGVPLAQEDDGITPAAVMATAAQKPAVVGPPAAEPRPASFDARTDPSTVAPPPRLEPPMVPVVAAPPAADAPPPTVPPPAQVAGAVVHLLLTGGGQQVTITLAPRELGRVEISIARHAGGGASVAVAVERPETLDLLRHDRPQLQSALERAGLSVAAGDLTLHLKPPPHAAAPTQTVVPAATADRASLSAATTGGQSSADGQRSQGQPQGQRRDGTAGWFADTAQFITAGDAEARTLPRDGLDITA
jgi:hypothetical protein